MKYFLLTFFTSALCFSLVACAPFDAPTEPSGDNSNQIHSKQDTQVKKIESDAIPILFLGDSLTYGYGLKENENYPALLQEKFQNNNLYFRVINAGVSGDTTAGGLSRVEWLLDENPRIAVIALGANDALRSIDPQETEKNLRAIIEKLQKRQILVILGGMKAPRNLGPDFSKKFDDIYPRLAAEYGIKLLPFFLEGVASNPKLNQSDGIHPNAEGTKKVAENFWNILKPILTEFQNQRK